MVITNALKAIADETRMQLLILLLQRSYCVRALARKQGISESAVSQHLKILREAGLVGSEKRGRFLHYYVCRDTLHELAEQIEKLAAIERQPCSQEHGACSNHEASSCHRHENTGISAGGSGSGCCHTR